MRFEAVTVLLASVSLAGSAIAINIISSNDDGWAEANIRAFYDALTAGGHSVVVSAPAENQSGTVNGNNIGLAVLFSGTVGAVNYAVHDAGIPAIAFSGATGLQTAWNASLTFPHYSQVYADLSLNLTNHLVASSKPYLPKDVWLNVNYPSVSGECNKPGDFSFVLSRIHVAVPLITPDDVATCGSSRLPSEIEVSLNSGCYTSVSVAVTALTGSKSDANATMQGAVLKKLDNLLTCLP